MSPAFSAVLIMPHPKEAFDIGPTHIAIPHSQAIPYKFEPVLVVILFPDQVCWAALQLNPFKYGIYMSP